MFRRFRLRVSVDDHIQQYICTLTTDTLVSRYRWSTTSMTDTLECTDPKKLDGLLNMFIDTEFGIAPDSFRLILV